MVNCESSKTVKSTSTNNINRSCPSLFSISDTVNPVDKISLAMVPKALNSSCQSISVGAVINIDSISSLFSKRYSKAIKDPYSASLDSDNSLNIV